MDDLDFLTIKEASEWASEHLKINVTPSNIAYLINYGKIKKHGENGSAQIRKKELIDYYASSRKSKERIWKNELGEDLNWALSFDQYKEAETTKHVHRLHPYKGKFIPQLVEYFLDDHLDNFKQQVYFHPGDIILDPFSGSGTTMVQGNELGMHVIGIDISEFNSLIGNSKVKKYKLAELQKIIIEISIKLKIFVQDTKISEFEESLLDLLYYFNNEHFPVPDFKYKREQGLIDEDAYGAEKIKLFLPVYDKLVKQYNILLHQDKNETFLDKWYIHTVRDEIEYIYREINKIDDVDLKNIVTIILSRTIRSCRATTHSDLATLIDPVYAPYYCSKHGKICKPLFSILKWWDKYSKDTLDRLKTFTKLRTDTFQYCLTGDSRSIEIFEKISEINPEFYKIIQDRRLKGIFSSPPYVGLIDYHEQHAYAYDLFKFQRRDELEIGPLFKGQGREAKESYIEGISKVLINCKRFFVEDYDVFFVANDKYNVYPTIAQKAGMEIVKTFKRPVLNRTEKDKSAYSEIIFHLKNIPNVV